MSPRSKPGGRWWLWPFGLAVLAVLLLSLLRWLVQPERLGAYVLQRAEAASGLRLQVEGPPRLGIWPGLHLQLQQLRVSDPTRPGLLLAKAEKVSLYLPLSALRGDQRIEAIALTRPLLDLDALGRRSAGQVGPPAPPWLPEIAQLQVEDGSLLGHGWTLQEINLDLRGLMQAGTPLRIDLGARLRLADGELPLRLRLEADNPETAPPLAWAIRSLRLGDPKDDLLVADGGEWILADWARPKLALAGRLQGWPGSWPPLPEALSPQLAGLDLAILLDPGAAPRMLHVEASAADRSLRLRLDPSELAAWVQRADWLLPMPAELELSLERIEIDGVRIEGMQIRHGDDAQR